MFAFPPQGTDVTLHQCLHPLTSLHHEFRVIRVEDLDCPESTTTSRPLYTSLHDFPIAHRHRHAFVRSYDVQRREPSGVRGQRPAVGLLIALPSVSFSEQCSDLSPQAADEKAQAAQMKAEMAEGQKNAHDIHDPKCVRGLMIVNPSSCELPFQGQPEPPRAREAGGGHGAAKGA